MPEGLTVPAGKGAGEKKLVVLRDEPSLDERFSCFRLDGFLFARGSSFVNASPGLVPSLRRLKQGLDACPDAKIAIFGHADYVGDLGPNKMLSERRAEAVFALLTLDKAVWERLYKDEHWDRDKSVAEALPGGLADIEKYLQGLLGKAGLAKVSADRFLGIWPKKDPKNPFMGCSEFNPLRVFSPAELAVHKKDPKACRSENEANRRVVIYFFHKDAPPKFPCMHSSEGGAEKAYKNCLSCMPEYQKGARYKENFTYEHRKAPTFACPFYDTSVAAGCKIEHELPKPSQSAVAAILIKGYELGLHKQRYLASPLRKGGQGQGAGLLPVFKHFTVEYDEATRSNRIARERQKLKNNEGFLRDYEAKRAKATDPEVQKDLDVKIEQTKALVEDFRELVEYLDYGISFLEHRRRIAGSVLQDMWLVERLAEAGGEPTDSPQQPLPFRKVDWTQAKLLERRGGAQKALLDLRADELAKWIGDEPPMRKVGEDDQPYWDRLATPEGRKALKELLAGRAVPATDPNAEPGKPPLLPRTETGLATVGFEEQDPELPDDAKPKLLAWVKACVADKELPTPAQITGAKEKSKARQAEENARQKKEREEAGEPAEEVKEAPDAWSRMKWQVYIFVAPSKKELADSPEEAQELARRRAILIRKLLVTDPALKDVLVSGFGGKDHSPWPAPATAVDQVWALALSNKG